MVSKLIPIVNCSRSTEGPGPSAVCCGHLLVDGQGHSFVSRIGLWLVCHETLLAITTLLAKDADRKYYHRIKELDAWGYFGSKIGTNITSTG